MQNKKKCKYCGTSKNLYKDNIGRTYNICLKCRPNYLQSKSDKSKETLKNKYGVINPSQLKSVKDKKRQTMLANFNVEYPSQSPEIRNKIKKSNLRNWGVSNVAQSEEIKNKKRLKSLEKYNTPCTLQGVAVMSKTKQTLLNKYNTDHPLKNNDILRKQELTNIKKFGHRRPVQNITVKDKMFKTNINKYGVHAVTLVPAIQYKMRKSFKINNWENFVFRLSLKKIKPDFDKQYYITNENNFVFICERCSKKINTDETNPIRIHCTCTKNRSFYEDEIINFIKSLGIKNIEPNKRFMENNIYKYEVDIFLENFKLGIDFCGLYWHCDLHREKFYHQKKWKYFKDKKIQLIQIFENEWIEKSEIIKSIIINKLSLNKEIIYARKCTIKEIDAKTARNFLIKNHLQGYAPSRIRIGLFQKDELRTVATFGKNRFSNTTQYELIRFASKGNTNIIGGFEKIISYFKKIYKHEIISYIDLRYFNGNAYLKSGFKIDSITKPNYFYFKTNTLKLENRLSFQKHKLSNKLEFFNPELSEYENMIRNKYYRIFDAGNLKMVKSYARI